MAPPAKRSGPLSVGPLHHDARINVDGQSLRERWYIGRLAHLAMPLTVYYGPRPLLDVPLGALDARGRWAP